MQFSEFATTLDAALKEASETFPVAAQFGPIINDVFSIALASPVNDQGKLHYVQVSLPITCDLPELQHQLNKAITALREKVAPDNKPKAQVITLR